MKEQMKRQADKYETIIVGAGAAGLFCACGLAHYMADPENILILEKTSKSGTKLLMSGNGQCNITHGGHIRDFLSHYGTNGKKIRRLLQKHSNTFLCRFMESIGVSLTERDDGKIFPSSMESRQVLEALLRYIDSAHIKIVKNSPVTGIIYDEDDKVFLIETSGERLICKNLVLATGGCSYPATGSDGSMFEILKRNLDIKVCEPKPALTPVYVENYNFSELSGMSFKDITMRVSSDICRETFRGDLLFTHKNISGPLILNNSRYISPGAVLTFNFLAPTGEPEIIARFKRDFTGNGKSPQGYMSDCMRLPKRFARIVADKLEISDNKVSQLTGSQIKNLAAALTAARFTVSGLAGFKEAMVTKGGVSLEELDINGMKSLRYPKLYFIGEMVDVDGDTGGYNLQFAFSSAWATAADISRSADADSSNFAIS